MSLSCADVKAATPCGQAISKKEGWLQKEGGGPRTKWQSRWFVLQEKTLTYFTKKDDLTPNGIIHLEEVKDVSIVGDRSGKQHCFSVVTTKAGNKKVYYLSTDSDAATTEWFSAVQTNISALEIPIDYIKYATVEVFLTQGVRVMGDVNFHILSQISHRVGVDKKKRDNFGWFCDRPITLAAVLNLFAEFSWVPEKIYRSTAISGTDSSVIHPVIRVIFSKSPPINTVDNVPRKKKGIFKFSVLSQGFPNLNIGKSEGSSKSGDCVPASPQGVGLSSAPGTGLIEGADDELISLMEEFNIPLSLLEIHPE